MFEIGSKVRYQPDYYGNRWDNGIVKEKVDCYYVRVVFHCDNDWEHYQNYTAALTRVEDLRVGWR